MPVPLWPVQWPAKLDLTPYTDEDLALAELYAGQTMRMLTLYRVGNQPVTVMPCGAHPGRVRGHVYGAPFHPVLTESGAIGNCWCGSECYCSAAEAVSLDGPVGRVDEVRVDGEVLPPSAYRVDNGSQLVRTDGGRWPVCSREGFTVTYLNAYPVDAVGAHAGGLIAWEYLQAITGGKKCRLPANVTAITRQGTTMEIQTGMFPGGTTGINEVDAYLMVWNPHGMRVAPQVYSIDSPRSRQTTLGGL